MSVQGKAAKTTLSARLLTWRCYTTGCNRAPETYIPYSTVTVHREDGFRVGLDFSQRQSTVEGGWEGVLLQAGMDSQLGGRQRAAPARQPGAISLQSHQDFISQRGAARFTRGQRRSRASRETGDVHTRLSISTSEHELALLRAHQPAATL